MKVSEAISRLQTFGPDLEILDEYAENELADFRLSCYDDDDGVHDYVAFDIAEVV